MLDKSHLLCTDETAEDAALYCLGDFSPEDRKKYEEHLSSCGVCRSEVEKYASVLADLAMADTVILPSTARTTFLTRVNDKGTDGHWAKLNSVLITPQLPTRPLRKKNKTQVSDALQELSTKLSGDEQEFLEALVRAALQLCDAGTAGFSVLYEDEQVFRWDALAGALAAAKGGTTPRSWSPCGTTLDLGTPQLFSHPGRCFEYFNNAPHQIFEGLVVPVYVDDKPLGTLWVASHDDSKFDKEDLRNLQSLSDFCGVAVDLIRRRQAGQDVEAI